MTGLRRLTWWTIVACLALIVVLLGTASPALIPGAAFVCLLSGHLFAVTVLGATPIRTPFLIVLVVIAALAGGAILFGRTGFPWVLPLAALIAAGAGHRWWPLLFVPAAAATSWHTAAVNLVVTALCAAGIASQVWFLRFAERGRRREEAAAVGAERLRFAAELHDIQGHSLQVIALKSELAARLADSDPARAAAEMRDVQALAHQALGDTRSVVQGYRAVSLDTEISNAGRVLTAAGIEASLIRPSNASLPPPVERLFGLVVRECTTNVLRHSAAGRCEVALTVSPGVARLRFTNDQPLDATSGPAGGLAALTDRLTAAGGDLTAERTAEEFTVRAWLPAVLT